MAGCRLRLQPFFLAAAFALLAGSAGSADSGGAQPAWGNGTYADLGLAINKWPEWTQGFDLGFGFLGHLGVNDTSQAPGGTFTFEGRYHVWYDHLIAPYVCVGVGFDGTFYVCGGIQLNLVEFTWAKTLETSETSGSRGLLASFLKNFMIYASPEVGKYWLPGPPAGSSVVWNTVPWVFEPEMGGQWYIMMAKSSWARRLYIEAAGKFTILDGAKFLYPIVRTGVELR